MIIKYYSLRSNGLLDSNHQTMEGVVSAHEWVQQAVETVVGASNPPNWECRLCGAVYKFSVVKPLPNCKIYIEHGPLDFSYAEISCNEFIANKVLSE